MFDFKGLRVLVLDGYGKQVAAILTELHKYGVEITTLNYSKLDIGYSSRYPDRRLLEPRAKTDKDYLAQVIDREIRSGRYDVVFPMLEAATDIVLRNEKEYGKYIHIAAAPYDSFILAYDKQNTMRICQEIGIPCPLTRMDGEDLDEFLDRVEYPIAIKPRKGSGSIGFKRINEKARLMELIEDGTVAPDEYVIQECVQGFKNKFVTNLFFDEQGEVKSSITLQMNRWYPIDSGPNCMLWTVDRPDITDYSTRLLKAMNWRGFGQVCYMEDPRDLTPKILEINGRIPASIKINQICGIPIVGQILSLAMGRPVPDFGANKKFGVRVRQAQADLLWFLESPDRWTTKPSWFDRRNTQDTIFSVRDPLPFFTFAAEHLLSYRSDMKKRDRH